MAKWTLDGYDKLCRDGKHVLELGWFDAAGTAELRARIVALLNAAEPGGAIADAQGWGETEGQDFGLRELVNASQA